MKQFYNSPDSNEVSYNSLATGYPELTRTPQVKGAVSQDRPRRRCRA